MSKRRRSHKIDPELATEQLVLPERSPFEESEAKGAFCLVLAFLSLVSTLSFAYGGRSASNWLGLIGLALGRGWFALFGTGSYLLIGLLGWLGYCLFFHSSLRRLKQSLLPLLALTLAIDLILCLVEDGWPELAQSLADLAAPLSWQQHQRYHLGGAPLYYLYRDLPSYNLLTLLNSFGVLFLALSLLATSLLALSESHPRQIAVACLHYLRSFIKALRSLFCLPKEREEQSASWSTPRGEETVVAPLLVEEPQWTLPSLLNRSPTSWRALLSNKAALPAVAAEAEEEPLDEMELPSKRRTKQMLHALVPREAIEEVEPLPPPRAEKRSSLISSPPPPEEESETEERELPVTSMDEGEKPRRGDLYQLPSSQLLTAPQEVDGEELLQILREQAQLLEETLLNFGIEAKVGNINCGPTIASFEVLPAVGVKVQRIKALANDIALNLQARSLRIIAPIPGKACVGIEIPNPMPQEVGFQELLNSYRNGSQRFHIPLLLGKAVSGELVMSDLAKMPHLIIAGATGSGKSVCINTIVMSIVHNARPDEIKLVMVDPKKVELTPYSRLPHMLAPVITEPQGACCALQWLVKEMERRYELFKLLAVRNIASFNRRSIDAEKEFELVGDPVPEQLHYIVTIIDELADLMMVSSQDIETYIARIAQMARAVGIHLILATQRPSREVITGLIKANFPVRMAFKVSSRVNSQIILDDIGAETLLGNGDMLFLPPGTSHLLRVQGAYICDADIHRVVEYICRQSPPSYEIASFDEMAASGGLNDGSFSEEEEQGGDDPLFPRAKELVVTSGNASTTYLQRRLKIGYARAASLMDQLERQAIVGPADGSRPRKILVRQPASEEE